ncbi:MAG: hypothetical protein JWN98_2269 [Abditibacteriota bacterium]|nr:hypothetical protein [Abditibacteriota bacterium]
MLHSSFVRLICSAAALSAFYGSIMQVINTSPAQATPTSTLLSKPVANRTLSRTRFVGLTAFDNWTKSAGLTAGETVWTSPEIEAPQKWNELVASWNIVLPPDGALRLDARAIYPERATKYFGLGLWADDDKKAPRESVLNQKDADGDVDTDTLVLTRHAAKLQLRLTLKNADIATMKFLGLCFTDTSIPAIEREPNFAAWDKILPTPRLFQNDYEGGNVWCSPTSTAMILNYWSKVLSRPELERDVPAVVKGVYDRNWKGTGNWIFNTAYAGALPGLRAYVTRFDDLRELEDWIAAGYPVALSISYDLLKNNGKRGSGHLVVCRGFTETGEVVLNDPGRHLKNGETYHIHSRERVLAAWEHSRKTAYLIYPENRTPPVDRLGHWHAKRDESAPK